MTFVITALLAASNVFNHDNGRTISEKRKIKMVLTVK